MRGDVAAQGKGRVEVHLQNLSKVGVGERLGGVAALDAGAVDQEADLVAVGEDAGDEGRDGGSRGEVGGVDGCFAAEGLDSLEGGLVGGVALDGDGKRIRGCLLAWGKKLEERMGEWLLECMFSHLDENEVCAGFCQGNGDGLPDASRSTSHEGGLAFKGEESVGDGGHVDFFEDGDGDGDGVGT